MNASGARLVPHGWIHERNTELSAERERELTRRAAEYVREKAGMWRGRP